MTVTTGASGINIPAFKAAAYSMMTDNVILIYIDSTTQDSSGMVTDGIKVPVPAVCRIEPVSDTTRILDDHGQVITGDRIGYFKPVYALTYSSVDYSVVPTEDMLVIHGAINYRIQKILKYAHIGDNNIYIKAVLKRI